MKKLLLGLLGVFLFLLTSCQKGYSEDSFFCMDTLCTVKVDQSVSDSVKVGVKTLLNNLDGKFSSYKDNSETSLFNESESGKDVSADVIDLVSIGKKIEGQTQGCFSVFAGNLTSLWSESKVYPQEELLALGVESVKDGGKITGNTLEKPNSNTKLEFGGIAKGYACDRAVEYLKSNGVKSAMVSFVSSIGVFGTNSEGQPWRIALKNPTKTDSVVGVIVMNDGFLSVSGDYERYYEIDGKRYNHILDPRSGLPVENGIHSVAVVAPTGAESDALSTAFFVMGVEDTEAKYKDSLDIKYLFITDSGVFMNSSMAEIFTQENQ